MTKDNKPTDDLRTMARAGATELAADTASRRLDYGDAAQQAEMDAIGEAVLEESMEMVDAPRQPNEPTSRADKKRNQRR